MKKRISIFWNIALIQLLIVFIAESVVVAFAYATVSNMTYEHCYSDIEKYASVVEYAVSKYDLDDEKEAEKCSAELDMLCKNLEAPYIYALEINEETNSEKYLAIGFGEGATTEAKETRYSGVEVKGKIKPEMTRALKNDGEAVMAKTNNNFGNSLICYKKIGSDKTNTRIIGVERSIADVVKELGKIFNQVFIITLMLTLLIVLSFSFIVYKKVSIPAREISTKMNRFVSDHEEGVEKLPVKGSMEFSHMADAFNRMTDEINQYIDDIKSLNREKHMQEAELNIAKNIQLGLLAPNSFNNGAVNINAYMLPAKEVGGDMYDYHILESGEVCLAVADVSGKGVSASLFMARALTLLHIYGNLGMTPSKTAEAFNNALSQNNPNKLFITAFLAKYNPKTRVLTYTNVGHNPPYIISDQLKMIDDAHGMAAGIFPDVKYEEKRLKLKEGDALFAYTDGVTEAQNKNGELLTNERLEKILAEHIGGNKKEIVESVKKAVNDFSNGAVQSDDITMLNIVVEKHFKKSLHLKSEVEQLTLIKEAIDSIPDLSFDDKWSLNLMAEEIFVNICNYAYQDTSGGIEFSLDVSDKVEITFEDWGTEYDPTKNLLDIETYDHNNTVGGLGKFITFNTADSFDYHYEDGKNILKLVKNIGI